MDLNLTTQVLGVLCFAGAALSCGLAWRRTRSSGGIWAALMLLHAGLTFEVVLQFRHVTTAWLRGLLRETGLDDERTEWQMALIVLSGICVLALTGWLILSRLRRAGRAVCSAGVASLFALCFFGLELISLHGVEAVLYRPAGPVLMIGWAWAVLALVVSLGASEAASAH